MKAIKMNTIIHNNSNIVSNDIILALKNIFDPEIDVSIFDLGLIYEIFINISDIKIIMTLTTINCPEAQSIPNKVKEEIEKISGIPVNVELTFDPEWSVDNMSDEVKLSLGLL